MNRTIWMLWLQGWDKAPDVCHRCVASWKFHNPTWDLRLLDARTVRDHVSIDDVLPGLRTNNISYGDIIRLFLLKTHGGVWADATVFCNRPLDEWLPEGPFLYDKPRADRFIASWFIKADHPSELIDIWYAALVEYWQMRIAGPDQFALDEGWIHRLFEKCYAENTTFRKIWDSVEKVPSRAGGERGQGPHFFTPYWKYYKESLTDQVKAAIDSQKDAMYKLSYKVGTDWRSPDAQNIHPANEVLRIRYAKGGALDYLFSTVER